MAPEKSDFRGETGSGVAGLLNFPPFYQLPRAFCGYRMGGEFGDYSLQGSAGRQVWWVARLL